MQEFSSVSVSSYEAGMLAERLTEQSRDGWHVVAIVPTGSTVTAYLSRADSAGEPAAAAEAVTPEPVVPEAVTPEPVIPEAVTPEPVIPEAVTPEPVVPEAVTAIEPEPAAAADTTDAGRDGWGAIGTIEVAGVDVSSQPAAAASAADTSAATDTASTAGAAPAGWYADPSTRFELRYWDGAQWTEHVSRAGQQYTDPPVA
jgi:hypothetical protein